jgi:hypothetical protein
MLLGADMSHNCEGAFPGKEGGILVLTGLAPSSRTVGSLLGTFIGQKNLSKSEFGKFIAMQKYAQLLFTG